jgi:hypothetical protein
VTCFRATPASASRGRLARAARGRPPRAATAAAAALGAAVLAAGCGSAAAPAAAPAPRPVALPLATSAAGDQATWATVPMGTTGPNLFWELFVLPAAGTRWTLATPPDVATNGAIALAPGDGTSIVTGIHPSLLLGFSPITSTPDGGRTWSAGAPDPGLASVPDALAAAPAGGALITLDHNGHVELGGPGSASRPKLTSLTALAATPAGRACQLGGLTAVAFSPAGSPMLAGQCARPGVAGIFQGQGQGQAWRATGPTLPAPLSRQRIEVLRLTRAGDQMTALLQAGAGPSASLVAAWSATGSQWTLSPPLRLNGLAVESSSFGQGSLAVTLTGRRGEVLTGPAASWQPLPELPAGRTVTLALPKAGIVDALAASGSDLTAWQLPVAVPASGGTAASPASGLTARAYGRGTWTRTQQTTVPIQYGSSS